MQLEKYSYRLTKLERIIERGTTGTPTEIAKQLGISRSMLYEYLRHVEIHKGKVIYSRKLRKFCIK